MNKPKYTCMHTRWSGEVMWQVVFIFIHKVGWVGSQEIERSGIFLQ